MRQLKYITLLLALVGVVSCVKYDIDNPALNKDNTIQVVGRVRPYSNINVGTKANDKVGDEGNTVCMCLVVIGTDNKCKRKEFSPSSHPTFTIDKSSLADGDMLYIFANIPNPDLGVGDDLEEFLKITNDVSGITEIPEFNYDYTYNDNGQKTTVKIKGPCLPMIGSMVISDVENLDPILPIGLESIYAKIVVNILSKPDQKVNGISPASFSLSGFEVKNVAGTVDFKGGTESTPSGFGDNDNVEILTNTFQGKYITSDFAQSDRQASFYFYLPERFLHPATPANSYDYPFGRISGLDDDEKQKFPQRYKPVLAEGLDATYVTFYGEYIDHQGQNWNVSYDIYLGNDNYSNFDIVRNTQYTNTITIKGISTSNDQTANNNSISIDHRVDIERVSPIIVNLRRETLLDSHFEVRPLRIRMNNDFKGQNLQGAKVVVEVLNADTPNNTTESNRPDWIRLEHKNSDGGNTATYLETGKRRYFTYGLITGKDVNGNTETNNLYNNYIIDNIPITSTNQSVWVYADECINTGDDVRSAIIRVTAKDANGNILGEPADYVVNQRMLYPVSFTDENDIERNYYMEFYEEYLYNYDSDDTFGQTEWNGMPYGLEEVQLSHEHDAIHLKSNKDNIWDDMGGNGGDAKTEVIGYALDVIGVNPKYDFYLIRDTKDSDLIGKERDYSGIRFNTEIASYLKTNYSSHQDADNKNAKAKIEYINLSEQPKSAFAYCYNRNKRNIDGTIASQNWFLPAIDEIEGIVKAEYASYFPEFQNQMYWSCQPSSIPYYIHFNRYNWIIFMGWGDRNNEDLTGSYYIDDINYARATKVNYQGKDNNGNDKISIPSSAADIYQSFNNGKFYYSNGVFGSDASINKTMVLGTPSAVNEEFRDNHEGNKPRTDYARVRCVRVVNP